MSNATKGMESQNRPITAKERILIEHILADYLATVDSADVGIILFQRGGGRLSSLEVYSQAGTEKPFGLPEIESIYSYEELAERQKTQNRPN